jgi:catechol 2,3-dioxygenase-like lactoylglutathione lyase family enzyme
MSMLAAIPAFPVSDVTQSLPFYRDRLGMRVRYQEDEFLILTRDQFELHLWAANKPDIPGAEPFIAGTTSCRVQVSDVGTLYAELQPLGIVHPNGPLADKPWGTREFAILDPDNNLITFCERQ